MGLVGRAVERTILGDALAEALAGRGGLVLLAGDAGIGKTALATYAADLARSQGAVAAWGRCREGTGAPAFWPWTRVVQPWPEVGEDIDRFELFEGVTSRLTEMAQPTGLVVVLDDLHWADDASIRLLDHVASALHDARVLVIGTYRLDEVDAGHPLQQALGSIVRHGPQLILRGLADVDVAAIARDVARVNLDAASATAITVHTDGNPFFVAEVMRLLASEHRLDDLQTTELGVPSGVAAVVRQRVAKLGEESVDVLAAASVIGRVFDESVLLSLFEGKADVVKAVDGAVAASLLEPDGQRPGRYRFSHALVREVAYGDLPRRRRATLHAELARLDGDRDSLAVRARHAIAGADALGVDAAAAIAVSAAEQELASAGWESAERLTTEVLGLEPDDTTRYRALVIRCWARFHLDRPAPSTADGLAAAVLAERCGWPDRFAEALLSIGSGRFTGAAFVIPTERFDACLAILDDGAETSALRANLISRKVDMQPLGSKDLEASTSAVLLARSSGDREAIITAASRFLLNFPFEGSIGSRRALVDEAVGATPLPRHEVGRHALDAVAFDVRLLIEEGRLDEALIRLQSVAGHGEISGGAVDLRFEHPVTACIATQRGDFGRAAAAVESWIAEASRRGTAVGGWLIVSLQIAVLRERGLWELILPVVEQARRDLDPTELALVAMLEATAALGFAELGQVEEALRAIDVVVAHDLDTIGNAWGGLGMAACCWLADAAALTEHTAAARLLEPIVGSAQDRNVVMGMPPLGALGCGSYYTGICALTLGRLDEARSQLTAALLAHERMGAWPIVARTRFYLARLDAADGGHDQAVVHAMEAHAVASAMAMPIWAHRADLLVAELTSGRDNRDMLDGTLTFVFTDIEDSTAQAAAVGDRAWASTMTDHGRIVRRLVAEHDGRVVKGLGDGFMLVFSGARHAVSCAAALLDAVAGSSTKVRIGMHTGEAELVEGDYLGHHVNLAARVSAVARVGEILVSDAVHRILVSSGSVRFGESRTTSLRGIPGDQVLWPIAST